MIRTGALAWFSALQFFIAQIIAAMAWRTPYSLTAGYISDLGNTTCGPGAYPSVADICSPQHAVMNASFIAIGITMAAGGWLACRAFVGGWKRSAAVGLFTIAGVGVILVGLYPENEAMTAHAAGARLNFVGGNIGLMLFGFALPSARRGLARFSVAAGVVGLAATALFASDQFLGLGPGGMERFAAYPMSVWQVVMGIALMRTV